MDIDSGALRMALDNGWVSIRDRETGDFEPIGPVFDDACCPREHREDWAYLLDRFHDATRAGEGCERAAASSYYDRLSPAHWN